MGDRHRSSLIRAKLNPPRLAAGVVGRPRLVERLERGRRLPLGLTCAPAGYGKSTLVASWLEDSGGPAHQHPFAWLSLDEADSDLSLFVEYLVVAIHNVPAVRGVAPGACAETLAMAAAPDPRPTVVGACLVNELEALAEDLTDDLVLVLDDYHLIHGTAVHELISHLLRYPPRRLHLEILARFDPPLPLHTLRAHGQVSEIRAHDLRFTDEESRAFFDSALGEVPGARTLARLEQLTEGWVVGMRLAALLGAGQDDLDAFLARLDGTPEQLQQYFVSEVLERQPAELRRSLLRASLVQPFCAGLLDELFRDTGDESEPVRGGEDFIEWLERSGLFLIALDARHQWFRFHHLFRKLLLEQLRHDADAGEIDGLRRRAAGWLEARGHLEEAMTQYGSCRDEAAAADLVKRHRHQLTRDEEWNRLGRWLEALTEELVRVDVELLVTRAWLCENRFRYAELWEILDEIEARAPADEVPASLRGEIDALAGGRHYIACDAPRSVAASDRALAAIPAEHPSERGFALVVSCLAHQMNGDLERAESVALAALGDPGHGDTYHTRILIGLCLVYWMDGDVARVIRTARELIARGERLGLDESKAFGRYFLGVGSYERGDLEAAEAALAPLVERRSQPNIQNWAHAAFVLAVTRLAAGDPGQAREIASTVAARALELQNPELLTLAEAFEAELALRLGRVREATLWARSHRPVVGVPRHRFFVPELTAAKVLLAKGSEGCRRRAGELLSQLRDSLSANHNRRVLVEVLVLRALLAEREGRRP